MKEDNDDVESGTDRTPCECGHAAHDHQRQGECSVDGCDCPRYMPEEDEEDIADGRL
jgi:hypothetical protein